MYSSEKTDEFRGPFRRTGGPRIFLGIPSEISEGFPRKNEFPRSYFRGLVSSVGPPRPVPYRSGFVFSRVTAGQARAGCGLQKVGPIPSRQSAQSLTGHPAGWIPKECIMTFLDAAGCSRTLQADSLHI
ncbi:hypothetical protein F2Q68_00005949 [Brassica cretica]|uniref:Uncharacterized protein n=1 Tax=Brassica cretica TaxID=69181 RepID=A0A8S9JDD4_BRACR|nr:hypothetical protein F2Q68_00005949 [Brassica cretica]